MATKWDVDTLLGVLNATGIDPAALGQLLGRSELLVELQQADAGVAKAQDRRAATVAQFDTDRQTAQDAFDADLAKQDDEINQLLLARNALAEKVKNALGGA